MKKTFSQLAKALLLGLVPLCALAAAPDLEKRVDLDAKLTIYSRTKSADGSMHTVELEEAMMRRGERVWKMRLNVPHVHAQHADHAGHAHGSKLDKTKPAANGGHEHFNPLEFGRVVGFEGSTAQLIYVKPEAKLLVTIPKSEFENVGFDGSWHRAYYLITPAELARLKPTARPSPVPGAVWYERDMRKGFERVLWDASKAIALQLESESADGRAYYRISVKLAGRLDPKPSWLSTKGFEERRYSDYLD